LKNYPLNAPAPQHYSFAVRNIPNVTVEQRERALEATHYNEFAFPASMLTVGIYLQTAQFQTGKFPKGLAPIYVPV